MTKIKLKIPRLILIVFIFSFFSLHFIPVNDAFSGGARPPVNCKKVGLEELEKIEELAHSKVALDFIESELGHLYPIAANGFNRLTHKTKLQNVLQILQDKKIKISSAVGPASFFYEEQRPSPAVYLQLTDSNYGGGDIPNFDAVLVFPLTLLNTVKRYQVKDGWLYGRRLSGHFIQYPANPYGEKVNLQSFYAGIKSKNEVVIREDVSLEKLSYICVKSAEIKMEILSYVKIHDVPPPQNRSWNEFILVE